MALAKKCDRCGRFYMHYINDNAPGEYNSVRLCRVSDDGRVLYEKSHMDLCPECMGMLQRYLSNKKMEAAKNEN